MVLKAICAKTMLWLGLLCFASASGADEDTAALSELLEHSRAIASSSPEKARALAEQVLEQALNEQITSILPDAYNAIGLALYYLSEYERALLMYSESYRYAKAMNEPMKMYKALNNIGILYYLWGNLDEAIEHYRQALEVISGQEHPDVLARGLNNLGAVAHAAKRYQEAYDYFSAALQQYELAGDARAIASIHNNLGLALLGLASYDSALERFDRALEMSIELENVPEQAISHQNRALAELERGNVDTARLAAKRALHLRSVRDDRTGTAMTLLSLGQIEQLAGELETSRAYLIEALDIAESLNVPELQRDALEALSDTEFKLGNADAALAAFKSFHTLYAAMLTEESRNMLSQARASFDVASQQIEIERLERMRQSQKYTAVMLSIAVVLLISTVILLIGKYLQRLRSQRTIDSKNQELLAAHAEREYAARREVLQLGRFISLGELAATIAHELNQPLASIRSNAQLASALLRRSAFEPDLRSAIEDIDLGSARSWELLSHLRRLSRRGEARPILTDLGAVIREAIEIGEIDAKRKNVSINLVWRAGRVSGIADRIYLQQALMNLISNAVAASSQSVQPEYRKVEVLVELNEATLAIAVIDFGPKVPQKLFARFQAPFFSTRSDGMGIGLTIARRLVESQSGTLVLAQNEMRGITAHIGLPIVKTPGNAAQDQVPVEPGGRTRTGLGDRVRSESDASLY